MNAPVWNERFVAYAAEHGRGPAEQLEHDRVRFAGGSMAGFMVWLDERWREFGVPIGRRAVTDAEQAEFTRWLSERPCLPAGLKGGV